MMTRKQLSEMRDPGSAPSRLDATRRCTIMATVGSRLRSHVTGGDQTPEDEDKVIRGAIGAALRELRIQGERTR